MSAAKRPERVRGVRCAAATSAVSIGALTVDGADVPDEDVAVTIELDTPIPGPDGVMLTPSGDAVIIFLAD